MKANRNRRTPSIENRTVTITAVTEGENCEMQDQEILDWYQSHVASLFDPRFGTPKITVSLERTPLE
jgi:hypothetical protein